MELLVIIATISILAALLMPALPRCQTERRHPRCRMLLYGYVQFLKDFRTPLP
jgi:hypothetical protein